MICHPFERDLSQDEFSQTSLYKEYACFNFSNFPMYLPGFENLCSPFPCAHASLPTLFGLKTNVKQGRRVGMFPIGIYRDETLGLERLTCRLVGWGR